MEKLNVASLGLVVKELNSKISKNFISHISVISSDNFVFSFSFYKREKLLISLNHSAPFISLIETKENFQTLISHTNEILRKYVSGSYVINVEQLKNDRLIKIELVKTNDLFEKNVFNLYIELITYRPNMILVDNDEKIIFATHYTTFDVARPIVKGLKYEPLKPLEYVDSNLFNLEKYKEECLSYLNKAKESRRLEQFSHLFTSTKSRIKSLERKIIILTDGINKANEDLSYLDMGNTLYTIQDKDELDSLLNSGAIKDYDNELSIRENAERYFKKYKKAKSTIEHNKEEIVKAEEEIKDNKRLLHQLENGDDTDLLEIKQSLDLNKGKREKKTSLKNKISPLFIEIEGGKIAFGKTDAQNNILTFERANKYNEFFHIADYPGSHVVILKDNANDNDRLLAAEIALISANKEDGDVQTTLVKNIKKDDCLGKVILKTYTLVHVNKIRKETYELYKSAKRL